MSSTTHRPGLRRPVTRLMSGVAATALVLSITACSEGAWNSNREAGYELDLDGNFGDATRSNIGFHTGELQFGEILAERIRVSLNLLRNQLALDERR